MLTYKYFYRCARISLFNKKNRILTHKIFNFLKESRVDSIAQRPGSRRFLELINKKLPVFRPGVFLFNTAVSNYCKGG